jgi:hypothetical protein
MADLHKAILALTDAVKITGDTQEDIIAYDSNDNEIVIDWDAINSWSDPEQYKYNRINAYPSLEEQLDMQYWDKVNGTNNWETKIAEIKALYPKPT